MQVHHWFASRVCCFADGLALHVSSTRSPELFCCLLGVAPCVAVLLQERAVTDNLTFVAPYDDPHTIAGQGTIGDEILRQVSNCHWLSSRQSHISYISHAIA